MCWGNNGTTIHALDIEDQAFITFEETLICARNPNLKPSLRSKYVKLMIGEYKSLFLKYNTALHNLCVDA